MLRHATLDQLTELKLHGMAKAFADQLAMPDLADMSFEERLTLLVEREITERSSRQLTARLRKAKLREQAAIEDINWRVKRGLDKAQVLRLASCQWIRDHANVLIVGKTGLGKSFLACALAHKAAIGDPTLADAILDRLIHGSYRFVLDGESMRAPRPRASAEDLPEEEAEK